MKLNRLGPNAHTLETSAGALLFSYETLVALRIGAAYYRLPGLLSTATRAHLSRFVQGGPAGCVMSEPAEFVRWGRLVLEAGERDLLKRGK